MLAFAEPPVLGELGLFLTPCWASTVSAPAEMSYSMGITAVWYPAFVLYMVADVELQM